MRVAGTSLIGSLLALGCHRQPEKTDSRPAPSASVSKVSTARSSPSKGTEPEVLLALPISAYHATVTMDGEVLYLLVKDAAYRMKPGHEPVATPLDLGFGAAVGRDFIFFWSKGSIFRAPKHGGKPERVAALERQPRFFVTSGEDFAWIDMSEDGVFGIQTLDRDRPRTVYTSSGNIDAAVMIHDSVVFLERKGANLWRFGRAHTRRDGVDFSEVRQRRTPAMLAPFQDHIYYYDGLKAGVRRITVDLQQDEQLITDFVCSPITVFEVPFCAQVEGLFRLPGDGRPPRQLTGNHARTITAMAAGPGSIAWVTDVGSDQLLVQRMKL